MSAKWTDIYLRIFQYWSFLTKNLEWSGLYFCSYLSSKLLKTEDVIVERIISSQNYGKIYLNCSNQVELLIHSRESRVLGSISPRNDFSENIRSSPKTCFVKEVFRDNIIILLIYQSFYQNYTINKPIMEVIFSKFARFFLAILLEK